MGNAVAISDPFLRKFLSYLLVGLFLFPMMGLIIDIYILIDSIQIVKITKFGLFDGQPDQFTIFVINLILLVKRIPDFLLAIFNQLLPALVVSICFQKDRTVLNLPGKFFFIITTFLIIGGAIVYFMFSALDPENFADGAEAIGAISTYASFCMNTGFVYFGLLAGISIPKAASY